MSSLVDCFRKNRIVFEAFDVLLKKKKKNASLSKKKYSQKFNIFYDDQMSETTIESKFLL